MKTTLTKTLATALPLVLVVLPSLAAPPEDDYDGDGRSDMFWRNTTTGANTIWKSGNAATPLAVASVTNQGWHVAGIGDFDGDGSRRLLAQCAARARM